MCVRAQALILLCCSNLFRFLLRLAHMKWYVHRQRLLHAPTETTNQASRNQIPGPAPNPLRRKNMQSREKTRDLVQNGNNEGSLFNSLLQIKNLKALQRQLVGQGYFYSFY